jgi:beta-lactamase superfamily II metal-dependent hydrolase
MPFEIDFHPVGNGAHSGDAITMRYLENDVWRVIVVDGGYEENGYAIVDHIRNIYGTETVDHVVSTHPDNDHITGLRVVLEELHVRNLWLHIPYMHAQRMIAYFHDPRWTLEGLTNDLRRAYPAVQELVSLAIAKRTNIQTPFQGSNIGPFLVLSPTVDMYEGLLPQFRDTPKPRQDLLMNLGHWIVGVGRRVAHQIRRVVREDLFTETLREGGTTAAENESSVVLYASLDGRGILLTADAGLRALETSVSFARASGLRFGENLLVFQVPHHGSRNNISPAALDAIVGPIAALGSRRGTWCVISCAPDDETHPRQVVVNALVRRGLEPVTTKAGIYLIKSGVPLRAGYGPIAPLAFDPQVEAYE